MIAEGIAALLAAAPDLEVVCVLLGGVGIGVQAALYKPDVALVDVCMGGLNGINAVAEVRRALPDCRVLGVSAYDDSALVAQIVTRVLNPRCTRGGSWPYPSAKSNT